MMRSKLSGHWRRLIAGCLAVLAAAFAVPRFVRAPDLEENRNFALRPELPRDLASLAAWPHEADLYVADHFPPRALLIGALNLLRLRIGASGSPRVIVGRDGWLFYDNDSHLGGARGVPRMTDGDARVWLSGLAGRTEALHARGVTYLVVAAPDKESVYPERAPAWFRLDPDRTAERLRRLAAQSGAGEVAYPAEALTRAAHAGLKVYMPYETHWTGLGAYLGYADIMGRLQAMGVTGPPRPLSAFSYLQPPPWGSPRNLALMLGVASFVRIDFPEVADADREGRVTTTYLSDEFDWTAPHVVDTGMPGKPVLLMTMDSFSTALLPFLYGDFSRIVLAHNQDGTWRQDLIDRYKPDVVIEEVIESSLPFVMTPGPQASAAALARIDAALAHPIRNPALPPGPPLPDRGPQPATFAAFPGLERKAILGSRGDDRLNGTPGDDVMMGFAGNDTLTGGPGRDKLHGGKGDDVIDGGPGDDHIWGDRGDDTLTGGPGADVFHGAEGAAVDLVTDFNAAEGDRIVLEPGARYTVRQAGADTVIEMPGTRMVLRNVNLSTLPRGWLAYRDPG